MRIINNFAKGVLATTAFLFLVSPAHSSDPTQTPISIPNAVMAAVTRVNDSGDTAGTYLDNTNFTGAFMDNSGTPQKFTVPWGTDPSPTGINNGDAVVGYYIVSQNVVRGFLRKADGTLLQIDPPGAVTSCPRVLTDAGDVAGVFSLGDSKGHGYIMKGSLFIPIDYPGAITTTLTDMNAAGVAAGNWIDTNNQMHGLLRSAQGRFTSVDFPGSSSTQAIKINSQGDLIGYYQNSNGAQFGFLRTVDGTYQKIAPPRATSGNTVSFMGSTSVVGMSSVDSAPSSPSMQGATAYLFDGIGNYQSVEVTGSTVTIIKGSSSTGWLGGAYIDAKNVVQAFKLKLAN